MLVLKRKEGQWIELTHRSGDTLRFRVYNIVCDHHGRVNIAFDDPDRHFEIQRPERFARGADLAPQPAGTLTPVV